MTIPDRWTTPARQLCHADAQAELARLESYTPWQTPDNRLRMDALELRLRELAGEMVTWPLLSDCRRCYGSGYETIGHGAWAVMGPCEACQGRGKVAIEVTDQAEIRAVPVPQMTAVS